MKFVMVINESRRNSKIVQIIKKSKSKSIVVIIKLSK